MPFEYQGTVSVHGISVAWACRGLQDDPAATLLARFPAMDGVSDPDLTLVLGPATDASGNHPTSEGYRQTCYFDNVKGFSRDGDLLLWDGFSRVRVDSLGAKITGEVSEISLTDRQRFISVMLFVGFIVALRHRQLFHIHAATLVHPRGAGWMLVGGSGAGKTTSTLSLLASGFGYLGDDATLLRHRDSSVEALSIPREFRLTDATLAAFSNLRSHAGEQVSEGVIKRLVDPREAFPKAFRPSLMAPEILLFPEVTGSVRTELLAMPAADAMGQLLLASAILAVDQMPHPREHLVLLQTLLRGARSFRLMLGQDVLARPGLLLEQIEQAL